MSEVVISIISGISGAGFASVIVLALSSWLGKIWIKRIFNDEKHKYEKELNLIKQNHETKIKQIESFSLLEIESIKRLYSITQNSYEKLFSDKIDFYNKLLRIKNDYYKKYNSTPTEQLEYETEIFEDTVTKLDSLIKDNLLLISNNLAKVFSKLDMKHSNYKRDEADNDYDADIRTFSNEKEKDEYIGRKIVENDISFRDSSYSTLSDLFIQIDKDVENLRKIIDLNGNQSVLLN